MFTRCFEEGVKTCFCCGLKTEEDLRKQKEARKIDVFFEERFYGMVSRNRKKIVAIFGLTFLVFFYFAGQIEPDNEAPQLFPDGDNYNEWPKDLKKYFADSSSQV